MIFILVFADFFVAINSADHELTGQLVSYIPDSGTPPDSFLLLAHMLIVVAGNRPKLLTISNFLLLACPVLTPSLFQFSESGLSSPLTLIEHF